MSNLLERLRAMSQAFAESGVGLNPKEVISSEAADRIEALEAENARLREALRTPVCSVCACDLGGTGDLESDIGTDLYLGVVRPPSRLMGSAKPLPIENNATPQINRDCNKRT
jgi:hypothetical protein